MAEFSIIEKYFNQRGYHRDDVKLGIGDDCAILQIPPNKQLAVSTDTLVAGRHFHHDMPARAVGHKSLAVNLSDLAAMGAEPAWVSLAITLPEEDHNWLAEFSAGFLELADYYQVSLVGGDTTQGPLSITVTVHGFVPEQGYLSRSAAKAGDWIYVTGELGDAALALSELPQRNLLDEASFSKVSERLLYPSPRVMAGQLIRSRASSGLDLSDGLMGDLRHIMKSSQVGARLQLETLPLSDVMIENVSQQQAIEFALAGGDDYELCFTVPEEHKGPLETELKEANIKVTCIGQLIGKVDEFVLSLNGEPYQFNKKAYQHFS